jgi:hypothetical protein
MIKCAGTDCKKRDTCVRFTCVPKPKYQSYLLIGINIKDVDNCKFYEVGCTQQVEKPVEIIPPKKRRKKV